MHACVQSTKRYAKLMLRRVDWTAPPPAAKGGEGLDEGLQHDDEDDEDKPPNR